MTERPDQSPLTSPRSQRVRTVAGLAGRSARRQHGRFRIEGPRAIRSLLTHRPDLVAALYVTPRCLDDHPWLPELARTAPVRPQQVDEEIIRAMVREGPGRSGGGPVSPQGAIAVARLPQEDPAAALAAVAALPATGAVTAVVLHEVRDPGNVGTLIRTADAAGADLVLLTRTCADPYAPKAVRASVGSLFHLPVVTGAEIAPLLPALSAADITAVATSGRAPADLFTAELDDRLAWILGNEAHGLDQDTLAATPMAVSIPLAGHAESLNVHTAATVCLFETLRRRRTPE